MAFNKILAQRVLNITRISSQSLTDCRISSSAVHARVSLRVSEPNIASDPGDNGLFRRFLHKRPVFQPLLHSPPIAGNLLEKLRTMNIAKNRIRLEWLTPPPASEMPSASEGVTIEDARKLLKAAQLESVKSRLREVAKSIQALLPGTVRGATAQDSERKELEEMEKVKAAIDNRADTLVRRELWGGLGFLVVQTMAFMRVTFWELTWDVMEPICFYVTSMYFMVGYTFFLRTSKEPSFEGFYQTRFNSKQKRLMKHHNFDMERYNQLKATCSPSHPPGFDSSVVRAFDISSTSH